MISCENVTLTMLVGRAYNVNYDQLVGPDWMAQQKFDIAARVPAGTSAEKVAAMWQRLLIDRFKLATHRESRVVAMFDLQVGKDGPSSRWQEKIRREMKVLLPRRRTHGVRTNSTRTASRNWPDRE